MTSSSSSSSSSSSWCSHWTVSRSWSYESLSSMALCFSLRESIASVQRDLDFLPTQLMMFMLICPAKIKPIRSALSQPEANDRLFHRDPVVSSRHPQNPRPTWTTSCHDSKGHLRSLRSPLFAAKAGYQYGSIFSTPIKLMKIGCVNRLILKPIP